MTIFYYIYKALIQLEMKNIYFLFISLLLFNFAIAQVTFQKTYGGTSIDDANSIQLTNDGGYIIAGTTASYGAGLYDVYLIKINAIGDTLWTKTYGGTDEDFGYAVQQTTDGGYIVLGTTSSFGLGFYSDIYLIKTDFEGNLIWSKTYGGDNSVEEGYFVQQTTDGGYLLTGRTGLGVGNTNIYVVKTTYNGDTLWTKTFSRSSYSSGYSVLETIDNFYIITGFCSSLINGSYDICIIKTDNNGDTLWTKTYGGNSRDYAYSIQQTLDGGFIIVGSTQNFVGGGYNVYLIKTDNLGNVIWSKIYVGIAEDAGLFVQQTSDGGYIITGYTLSFGAGNGDVYLIKTDALGDITWSKAYGGSSYDYGFAVRQTSDGGYIVAARSASFSGLDDVYIIKTDANGNSGCNEYITNTTVDTAATITIIPTILDSSGGIITIPNTLTSAGGETTVICTNGLEENTINKEISIYPNPTTSKITILAEDMQSVEVYNLQGQSITVIANEVKQSGNTSEIATGSRPRNDEIDLSQEPKGIYIIKVTTSKGVLVRKVILE